MKLKKEEFEKIKKEEEVLVLSHKEEDRRYEQGKISLIDHEIDCGCIWCITAWL